MHTNPYIALGHARYRDSEIVRTAEDRRLVVDARRSREGRDAGGPQPDWFSRHRLNPIRFPRVQHW